jgi:hypothetical protein
MLCPCCHGQHFVIRGGQLAPCPECGGMGEIHCCDGLTSQAESSRSGCVLRTTTGEEEPQPARRLATR